MRVDLTRLSRNLTPSEYALKCSETTELVQRTEN